MKGAREKESASGTTRQPEIYYNRGSMQSNFGHPPSGYPAAEHRIITDKKTENTVGRGQQHESVSGAPRHSTSAYARLYDHAPVSYFILDIRGTIHYVNPAGVFLLAETPASLPGRNFGEFVVERQRRILLGHLLHCAEHRESASIDILIKLPHGEQCVRLASRSIEKNDELLLRTMVITVDSGAPTEDGNRNFPGFDLKASVKGIQQEINTIRQRNQQRDPNHPGEPVAAYDRQEDISTTGDDGHSIRAYYEQLQNDLESKNHLLASMALNEIRTYEFIADWEKKLKEALLSPPSRLKKLLSGMLREIQQNLKINRHPIEQYISGMNQKFLATIAKHYPDLTPAEIRLCSLLRLDLTTKEVAQMLHITAKTVENQRYRLRRKLGLPRERNLTTFLVTL